MLAGGDFGDQTLSGFRKGRGSSRRHTACRRLYGSPVPVALRRGRAAAAFAAIPVSAAAPPVTFAIAPALIRGPGTSCGRAPFRHGLTLSTRFWPLVPRLPLSSLRSLRAVGSLEARPLAAAQTWFLAALAARAEPLPISPVAALGPILLEFTAWLGRYR
jgi:hypothetical protein